MKIFRIFILSSWQIKNIHWFSCLCTIRSCISFIIISSAKDIIVPNIFNSCIILSKNRIGHTINISRSSVINIFFYCNISDIRTCFFTFSFYSICGCIRVFIENKNCISFLKCYISFSEIFSCSLTSLPFCYCIFITSYSTRFYEFTILSIGCFFYQINFTCCFCIVDFS